MVLCVSDVLMRCMLCLYCILCVCVCVYVQYHASGVENRKDYELCRVNVTDRDDRGTGNWEAKYTIARGNAGGNFDVRTDPVSNQGVVTVVKVRHDGALRDNSGECVFVFCQDVRMLAMTSTSSPVMKHVGYQMLERVPRRQLSGYICITKSCELLLARVVPFTATLIFIRTCYFYWWLFTSK